MNSENDLYAISYISQSTIPEEELSLELQDIELTSMLRNLEAGLTGKLIYRHGHFVQRLEGPWSALEQTMARILADPRHRNLHVISREPIESRLYGAWQQMVVVVEGPELVDLDAMLDFMASRPQFSVRQTEAEIMLSALAAVSTRESGTL